MGSTATSVSGIHASVRGATGCSTEGATRAQELESRKLKDRLDAKRSSNAKYREIITKREVGTGGNFAQNSEIENSRRIVFSGFLA